MKKFLLTKNATVTITPPRVFVSNYGEIGFSVDVIGNDGQIFESFDSQTIERALYDAEEFADKLNKALALLELK